jgi:uncharacterized protein involved in copper resistance
MQGKIFTAGMNHEGMDHGQMDHGQMSQGGHAAAATPCWCSPASAPN